MARTRRVNGELFEMMISGERVKTRVRQLARRISRDYRGKVPVLIGVLNGSFIFLADLVRELTIDCEIDFLKLSSYGDAKISSGNVRLLKDLNCQVEGRDIIVVEDIVDSGLSVKYMGELIRRQNPKSMRFVTLLCKNDAVRHDVALDYIGFSIGHAFVIGYGLDYAQRERNLKAVYRLREQRKQSTGAQVERGAKQVHERSETV